MSAKKLPTMTDIAKLAGVSQPTVSLIMNGKADSIPQETQQRVLQASEQLGYTINRLASSLNGSGSGIIGMLTDELLTTNFAGALVKGAQDRAWRHNKVLFLASLDKKAGIAENAVDLLAGYRVESIIFATMYHHKIELPANLIDTPIVLVNCFESSGMVPCIIPDDLSGAYQATNYLLENGHRKIIYLSNDMREAETGNKIPATILREQGFLKCLADNGIPIDKQMILSIPINGKSVYEKACEILASPDRPTAIMCYNDRMAISVYFAASTLGLRIPEDLSVIGYDNQIVISEFLMPQLTTIELPHYELGECAVEFLFRHKYPFKPTKKTIKPRLIIRNSVKNIGNKGL